jgi:hypothetical protein
VSRKWLLSAVVLTLAMVPAAAHAAEVSPSLAKLFKMAGEIEYPPEWTGIWSSSDSLYDCEGNLLFGLAPSEERICAGDPVEPPEEGVVFECTGDATPPDLDITCTGTETVGDCTTNFTFHLEETLVGSERRYVYTVNTTNSAECKDPGDFCFVLRGTKTRISSNCTTPIDKSSWGQVKSRYR